MPNTKAPMLTLEQIKNNLADKRLYKVAEITGLSYPTLKKMADGEDANYTMATVQAVSQYIYDIQNPTEIVTETFGPLNDR